MMTFNPRHAAAAMALAVTGCALASATPPSVDVMDVHLVGLGLTEQQLAVTLCVTNPNKTELAFRRVTADLDVSGAPLASGASDLAARLPPLSSTPVPFTVITTVQNLGPQLLGMLHTGRVDYRVHGSIVLQGALGITLSYARSGRLDPVADGLRLADAATDPSGTMGRAASACAAPGYGSGELDGVRPAQVSVINPSGDINEPNGSGQRVENAPISGARSASTF